MAIFNKKKYDFKFNPKYYDYPLVKIIFQPVAVKQIKLLQTYKIKDKETQLWFAKVKDNTTKKWYKMYVEIIDNKTVIDYDFYTFKEFYKFTKKALKKYKGFNYTNRFINITLGNTDEYGI